MMVQAKGKQSKAAKECAAILKGLHDSMPMPLDELREHQTNLLIASRKKAEKNRAKPRKKADAQPDPLKPLIAAIREYERVSYYCATKGNFSFACDDEAQRLFHTFDPANAKAIYDLRDSRAKKVANQRMIPAGDFTKGLAIRTTERMKRKKGKKNA